MSMTLVRQLHEARDRIIQLKQHLEAATERELPAYMPFLAEQIKNLDDALEQAHIPECYRVAIVGRFKVGKSAFVNKLAGQRLAGVGIHPETAAISVFRYDTNARAEIELISQEDWERLKSDHAEDPKNNEVKRYDRFINFNSRKDKDGKKLARQPYDLEVLIKEWVQPGGKKHVIEAENWGTKEGQNKFLAAIKKFTTSHEPMHYLVNQLAIYAPIPILEDQIELIDTPGLDDTERFRVLLTEELVKDVDAILLLTKSGESYSQGDKDFIVRQLRRQQIKHLQVIVTKCDETYNNDVRDARANDDDPPSYAQFRAREIERIKAETKATLDELLQSNQLSDEQGYYFIEQLENIPIHLISTTYHDDGDVEKGGIEAVRNSLYQTLSKAQRFERAKNILTSRLEADLDRLQKSFTERLSTLEQEFDPQKVKDEIELIGEILAKKLDVFAKHSVEALNLLSKDQESFFSTLNLRLDNIGFLAQEALNDIEKADLIKHWKTRRYGNWGYMTELQDKVADRIFPKVESNLENLRQHLNYFMQRMENTLNGLQGEMRDLEAEHRLTGLEPIALASIQEPLFRSLTKIFENLSIQERDSIISKLNEFVTDEVQDRLDEARDAVSEIVGRGTTKNQADEIGRFYSVIRNLLKEALRKHLEKSIAEFAVAIKKHAESVSPRIREDSEGLIQQRLKAIESKLQVAASGQKEQVSAYLQEMIKVFPTMRDPMLR